MERLYKEAQQGDLANHLEVYLKEWLDSYSAWIIEHLKTCPDQEMAQWRSLLVACDAFANKLTSDMIQGVVAREELKALAEVEELPEENSDRWI